MGGWVRQMTFSEFILQAHATHSSMLWHVSVVTNVEIRPTKRSLKSTAQCQKTRGNHMQTKTPGEDPQDLIRLHRRDVQMKPGGHIITSSG